MSDTTTSSRDRVLGSAIARPVVDRSKSVVNKSQSNGKCVREALNDFGAALVLYAIVRWPRIVAAGLASPSVNELPICQSA